jgi:TrkA-C domain
VRVAAGALFGVSARSYTAPCSSCSRPSGSTMWNPTVTHRVLVAMGVAELELAVSVGMLCAAMGFTVGLVIGRGRQPRWVEKGSFVHKVSIGFATLDRLDAVLLRFEVEPASRLAGVEVDELRLPAGSAVSLITRGSVVLVPTGRTVLQTGDQVLAVAALGQVSQVEDRLRSVSRLGRLAGWYEGLEATDSVRALGVRRRPA